MGIFEVSYKQLNDAQRSAVDAIDGPVLVVAGPGTGKTQLLSMRVANILRLTDTDPGSILCLTFTNKAAINMRERLIALTGGSARNVMVRTFHSFSAELMNMYPDYFWNGAKLTSAPDAAQIEIIQNILGKLPLSNPLALKFAGAFTAGKDVRNALKHVKEAGLTPTQLKAIITANLAYLDVIEPQMVEILSQSLSAKKLGELADNIESLPNQGIVASLSPLQDLGVIIKKSLAHAIAQDEGTGKTKQTGKWKLRFVQTVAGEKGMYKERERNEWWLSLADVYAAYRDQLHLRGYYDYSDMIIEVITQLRDHADMRADAQERFQYVLVDEFQDTNAAQLQLAHLIADHHANGGKPNIMAVGDDDQSIYKFNGAELNNMLSFRSSYPSTKLIVLTDNYRSSQAVLDAATTIIEQAADRLVLREPDITKDLIARNPPKDRGEIKHLSYATEEFELSDIADRIESDYKKGIHDVAVLARDHASLQRLSFLLMQRNIPIHYEKQSNILEHELVRQVHAVCALLVAIKHGDKQHASMLLSQSLRSRAWNIPPKTLWMMALANRRGGSWLDYMHTQQDDTLTPIAEWLLWLAQLSENEPLSVTIEYIIGLRSGDSFTSPIREFYFGASKQKDSDYIHALSALRLLQSMVHEFAHTDTGTLEDYVRFIQLAIEGKEIIADESIFVSGENAVELLTVHKAKGLEFETVYVINAIDNNWKPSTGGRKSPANLPLQPAGDDNDDYARLMFVAATRAKRSLIITSYQQDVAGKDVLPSPLIHEALPIETIEPKQDESAIAVLEENLRWPRLVIADEKLALAQQLENFALSASSYLDFLDVSRGGPTTFMERHLLSLPSHTTPNMAFGTAIHTALEYAQNAVNSGTLDIESVCEAYQKALENQSLLIDELGRYKEHGELLLKKLFKSDTFWMSKGGLPEQSLHDISVDGAMVKGTLDRINMNQESLTIIDYKTGNPLSSFTTRDQNKAIKAWRHRTQLAFYTLLVKNSSRFKPVNISGQMWYVEASSSKELVREYTTTPEELARMTKLVSIIYHKIKDFDLPTTDSYPADYAGIVAFEQDLLDGTI